MAEPEAVLACELGPVRADQLLSNESGEAGGHLVLIGCKRLHRPAMEDFAFDRAALEHAALGGLELVEACREQRLQRRWDEHFAFCLIGHRQHLRDEERVAARRACDPLTQIVGEPLRDQLVDSRFDERLERDRDLPRRAVLDELRPRHAEQQDRRPGGEQRDVFDQVSEGLLAPLDVVEHDDQWPSHRSVLERLAERPGDLLSGGCRICFAEQRADRQCCSLVRRRHVELLQHLHDRPIGDPFAVWRTAAAHDGRLDRDQSFRDKPGLADPSFADHGHQLAALPSVHALPRLPQECQLALTADERGVVAPLRRVVHSEETVREHRLGLALQAERFGRFYFDGLAHELKRRLSQ